MDIQELKEMSNTSVLLRGKSGRGKTRNAVKVSLQILQVGGRVLYAESESQASKTFLKAIEDGDLEEGVVEELVLTQMNSYEDMKNVISKAPDYDLVVLDPLDHKHGFVLKEVTDAKTKADADWNEYPQIYSHEKELMQDISKVDANVLATLDPESGKKNKPKGTQTNIHGYFDCVVDLYRDGDDWSHRVENWIGRNDLVGAEIGSIPIWEALFDEIRQSTSL